MAIAAFTIVNLLIQLLLPLLILGARRIEPPQQSYVVSYSVRMPPADRPLPEPWTDRLLPLIRSDGHVQKGRLDVFPTRESAEEFCRKFGQAVRNEGWSLERCDTFPLGGADQS